jgi:hypothetical protein
MPRFLPDLLVLMGMGVALVLHSTELSADPSLVGMLMPLGWRSCSTLAAAVIEDDSGGTSCGDDDSERDASDNAAVLCNAAGLRNDASASHLLRRHFLEKAITSRIQQNSTTRCLHAKNKVT